VWSGRWRRWPRIRRGRRRPPVGSSAGCSRRRGRRSAGQTGDVSLDAPRRDGAKTVAAAGSATGVDERWCRVGRLSRSLRTGLRRAPRASRRESLTAADASPRRSGARQRPREAPAREPPSEPLRGRFRTHGVLGPVDDEGRRRELVQAVREVEPRSARSGPRTSRGRRPPPPPRRSARARRDGAPGTSPRAVRSGSPRPPPGPTGRPTRRRGCSRLPGGGVPMTERLAGRDEASAYASATIPPRPYPTRCAFRIPSAAHTASTSLASFDRPCTAPVARPIDRHPASRA